MTDSDKGEGINSAQNTVHRNAKGQLTGGNPGNSGGKKGRSGRKPHAWKEFCGDVLAHEDTRDGIEVAARTPRLAGYVPLLKLLVSYSEGLPTQTVEIEGRVLIDDIMELRGTDKLLPGEELADYEVLPAGDENDPDETD